MARIEAVVRRRKRSEVRLNTWPVLHAELEIRAEQYQAFVGGQSLALTRREFELLQLLAQVPVARGPGAQGASRCEVYLDAALAPGAAHRPRRVRDVTAGPLPRLFGERVVHVRSWAPDAAAGAEETVDLWF